MTTIVTRAGKGSALTWTEGDANITNLNNDKIELTDLSVTTGSASSGGSLSYNNTTGEFTFAPADLSGAGGIASLVEDTSPELGGDLFVNGHDIVSETNLTLAVSGSGNVYILPDTGSIYLGDLAWPGITPGVTGDLTSTSSTGNRAYLSTVEGLTTGATITFSGTGLMGTGIVMSTPYFIKTLGADYVVLSDSPMLTTEVTLSDVDPVTMASFSTAGSVSGDAVLTYSSAMGTLSWVSASSGSSTLGMLSDVNVMTPTSGQVLTFGATGYWENQTLSFLSSVSGDGAPQLGGNLDAQGYVISNPVLKDYAETVYSLGTTDSPTITISNGNVQTVTITSGLSLPAFADAAAGQSVTLIVTGSGTATGTANHKFAESHDGTLTNYSVISIFYDGTTYWTSIATNFA